jgi:tetratricopeptide (TPR) repeat protein
MQTNNNNNTKIVSFYSFKGGVGRTQLLANLASYLCYFENKKVLIIDWDLEAPGAHFYFKKTYADITQKRGLMGLLSEYVTIHKSGKNVETLDELPQLSYDKDIVPLLQTNVGKVDLLPAGDYANFESYRIQIIKFDWNEFYEIYDGKRYIEYFKYELKKLEYDFIFIDSRTGLSDYLNIGNIQMPDINVLVVAPNMQNIDGSERIAKSILEAPYVTSGKYRKAIVLPILSRVEENAPNFSEYFNLFRDKFSFLINRLEYEFKYFTQSQFKYFNDTMLPVNSKSSLGELLYFGESNTDLFGLAKQFANIAQYLMFFSDDSYTSSNLSVKLYGFDPEQQLISSGTALFEKGSFDLAFNIFEEVLKTNPNSNDALSYISYIADQEINNKNYPKASLLIEKAFSYNAHHTLWFEKARIAYNEGKYEDCIGFSENSISLNAQLGQSHNLKGLGKLKLELYHEAKLSFETAINIEPANASYLNNLALALAGLNDYENAFSTIDNAMKLNPELIEAIDYQGVLYQKTGQFEKAFEVYKKALSINPNFGNTIYNLASLYSLAKRDSKEAFKHLKSAIKIDPIYKKEARKDPDFKEFWKDPEFIEIVSA